MSGYKYGQTEPTCECPYCKTECTADFVDVGVGMVQCGPYHCDCCGASEIGAYDKERVLTDKERECGWYGPDSEPGSSANVIAGTIVDHNTMNALYRMRFRNNPDYENDGAVKEWFDNIRKPVKDIK